MVNRPDGLVEYYRARTLITQFLLVLTQRKGCTRLVIDSLVRFGSRFVIQRLGFISALKVLRLGL
jgi:hypothetical protein